jgi:hypothetical protein
LSTPCTRCCALDGAALAAYDVIVLHRDLQVVHGEGVCRTLAGCGPRILVDAFGNILAVTASRLRRRLDDPPLIETVVGKGYRV